MELDYRRQRWDLEEGRKLLKKTKFPLWHVVTKIVFLMCSGHGSCIFSLSEKRFPQEIACISESSTGISRVVCSVHASDGCSLPIQSPIHSWGLGGGGCLGSF